MNHQSRPDEKRCGRCGTWKTLSEFHRQADGGLGRQGICKSCNKIRSRDYARLRLHENPEEWRRITRNRVRDHRERNS